MPIIQNGQTFYTPREVADRLGISVGMLRYLRNAGRIEGIEVGTTTLYTEEQIQSADMNRKKRGPKSPQKELETDVA